VNIFVLGTRGIPGIPGGVESHCEKLYPKISGYGHHVTICTRSPYFPSVLNQWEGVQLKKCFAPHKKSLEAIVHTFLGILIARTRNPDLIHIHTIGPALLTPFAKLLGLKVVVTNHGPDYQRQKWGAVAKIVLRIGEYVGGRFADKTIVISSGIASIVRKRCRVNPTKIPNGVDVPDHIYDDKIPEKYGVHSKGYIIAVSRFVPEKGLHDLINAFAHYKGDMKLVIAGDADHDSSYSRQLKKAASDDSRIILTGYITGPVLEAMYAHARLFVLPSYHEGLPIVVLEALSYGLPVLVSNIPANLEVGLPAEHYFTCGSTVSLLDKLMSLLNKQFGTQHGDHVRSMVRRNYNWDKIAKQTIEVYKEVCK
jgi:glycosyltransferase involved in cell wall biosynthesis